jgi:hypothetical protein
MATGSILEQLTQGLAVMGQLPAANQANNATALNVCAGINMSCLVRLITYLDVGVQNTGANVQLYYRASATSNMASPTNVASAIPLTANTSNRVESLEVRKDQLPAGTQWVQPLLLINGSSVNIGAIVLGGAADYSPANQFGVANVLDQGIVT